MSNSTRLQTETHELTEGTAEQFELRSAPLDPKAVANLAEVRVPIPRSILLGRVAVPPGDPRGATDHALYLTPGGYAYRVTNYLGGRRANGGSSPR
ncbi:hypothetical protein [Streptomyces sp. NPDC056160]|uniref:hypothetical protein n=1 Tax=Streptomyces sp. NPDC056160 TaxID=3345731 RepID=UPI0035D7A72B